jgi:hypothetical protein
MIILDFMEEEIIGYTDAQNSFNRCGSIQSASSTNNKLAADPRPAVPVVVEMDIRDPFSNSKDSNP